MLSCMCSIVELGNPFGSRHLRMGDEESAIEFGSVFDDQLGPHASISDLFLFSSLSCSPHHTHLSFRKGGDNPRIGTYISFP